MTHTANMLINLNWSHWVKSVRIRSYAGPYSTRIRENTDQDSSEYGHVLRSVSTKLDFWQHLSLGNNWWGIVRILRFIGRSSYLYIGQNLGRFFCQFPDSLSPFFNFWIYYDTDMNFAQVTKHDERNITA